MFDKNKFAKVIKDIKETYNSQEEFAKKSTIGRTYLSQYMNIKLDKPPKPEILERLANASNGVVSYEDLMIMCGYLKNEYENYSDLLDKISKSKAYIDCMNLLKSTTLTDNEITKILYYVSSTDIENNESEIERMISSLFQKASSEHKELLKIVLVQYWQQILNYRKQELKFLNTDKDEQEFRFAYHKDMEGLTDEEISDALRFYKEMKKRVENDKK